MKKEMKPDEGISYQSKDITSKVLSECFKGKSLKVYGIDLPSIKDARPTNLPAIEANELRLDNLFTLEDDSLAIIDYESKYSEENKCKYLNYIARVTKRILSETGRFWKLRIIIIYTADIERGKTTPELDLGDVKFRLTEAFLSDFDPVALEKELNAEITNGRDITDEAIMKLIIFPLTFKDDVKKKTAVGRAIEMAEKIDDSSKQVFALTGLLTFTDKIIRMEDSSRIRRMIKMTKVDQIISNEIYEAVKETEKKALKEKEESAIAFLKEGDSVEKVSRCLNLPKKRVKELKKAMSA